jgi:hypothetical protein
MVPRFYGITNLLLNAVPGAAVTLTAVVFLAE